MAFVSTLDQNRFVARDSAPESPTIDFSAESLPAAAQGALGLEIDYIGFTLATAAAAGLRRPQILVMVAGPVIHMTWVARDTQTVLLTEKWALSRGQDSAAGALSSVHRDVLSPIFLMSSIAQFLRLSFLAGDAGDVLAEVVISGRLVSRRGELVQPAAIS